MYNIKRNIVLTTLSMIFVMMFGTAHAQVTRSGSYEITKRVAVDGKARIGGEVSLLLVKKGTDIGNIQNEDIGYASQTTVSDDGSYSFRFKFSKNMDDYELVINQDKEVINAGITKATAVSEMLKADTEIDDKNSVVNVVSSIENLYRAEDLSYKIMLACYSKEGLLLGCKTTDSKSIGTEIQTEEITAEIPEKTQRIKVFVWSGDEKMIPIALKTAEQS